MALELTTLSNVRDYMQIADATDTSMDVLIASLIQSYSNEFERYLNRKTQNVRRTEIHLMQAGDRVLYLDALPITLIVSLAEAAEEVSFQLAEGVTTLMANEVVIRSEEGALKFRNARRVDRWIQVSYEGGMAPDTANFIASFPDIETAIKMQIAEHLRRQHSPGTSTKTDQNSSESYSLSSQRITGSTLSRQFNLLDRVRSILDGHRNFDF